MGQRLRGGSVGNGLSVLLAYLGQLSTDVAHARLLQPTGQQRTGQRTSGGPGPPGDDVDGHAGHPIHAAHKCQYARRFPSFGPGMLSAPASYRMRRLISRAVMTAR